MNDPIARGGSRASGRWLVALLALAFVAGLTLMGYAARRWHWFDPSTSTASTAASAQRVATAEPAPALQQQSLPLTPAPTIDPAAIATREAALAGQLSALEARTAQVSADSTAAAGQARRAEALLVAVAARRQVDAGQPLGYLEDQLRERFGETQPRAVAVLIAAARRPVTLVGLQRDLAAIRSRLTVAPQDDLIDGLRRELATLIVFRRAGTASPLPADRIANAERLLLAGQVAGARAEVSVLPGATAAGGWLQDARRWILARQALDALEAAALTLPQPPAQPAIAIPPTTTTVLP